MASVKGCRSYLTRVTNLHGGDVLFWGNPLVIEPEPLLNLLLHFLPKGIVGHLTEAVNPAKTIRANNQSHNEALKL